MATGEATGLSLFGTASRTASYLLGAGVIALAVASGTGTMDAQDFAQWAQDVFGPTFTVLYLGLVATTLFCWVRLGQLRNDAEALNRWRAADC